MSEYATERDADGCSASFIRYTREEIRAAWTEEGQGHKYAVERGRWCVVTPPCSEDDALRLSALFVRCVFAIPTCCHYDGETLSLYCGDAGSGAYHTKAVCQMMVDMFFARMPKDLFA